MAKKRKVGGSRFPDAPGAASRNKRQKPGSGPPAKQSQQQQQQKKKNNNNNSTAGQQGVSEKGGKSKHQQYHSNQEPVIPFASDENILLIGEGDLSFAASLAKSHGCRNLTATVLEKNEEELLEKYPHVGDNITKILNPGKTSSENEDEDEGDAFDAEDLDEDDGAAAFGSKPRIIPNRNRILYNTDATTLKAFTTKPPRVKKPPPTTTQEPEPYIHPSRRAPPPVKAGMFQRIIFNFPHVGGKSTDVNRQVRHNQSLLVSFFERATPSLAPGGTVIVTLFEGEPYTLWNVRDLARHAGLAIDHSFKFPWASYPGYHHARTLGVVKARVRKGQSSGDRDVEGGEKDESDDPDDRDGEEAEAKSQNSGRDSDEDDDEYEQWGESKTAWKGEERAARSYVFKRKDELAPPKNNSTKDKKNNKKGKQGDADSDDDSD